MQNAVYSKTSNLEYMNISTFIRVILLIGVLMQCGKSAEELGIKDIQMASRVVEDGYTLELEHPKIFLGSGYSSGYDEILEKTSFFFDGLHVMIYGKKIYINNEFSVLNNRPKNIRISDDASKVIVDGAVVKLKKIPENDDAIDYDSMDQCKLDNGYRIDFVGGFIGASSGVGLDDNHYLVNRSGVIVKVWSEDLYLWGKRIGKMSQLADKNKVITLDLKKILIKK